MTIPAIGTTRAIGPGGRPGVVVAAQAIGPAQSGRQLVALTIRTSGGDGQDRQGGGSARPAATSTAARPEAAEGATAARPGTATDGDPDAAAGGTAGAASVPGAPRSWDRLTPAEKAQLAELRRIDAQVRQEETAHANAAGQLGGPISYVYERGPDGRLYAVGGAVPIRAQSSDDPEEAARLGRRIAAAAFAATLPSSADYAAAASAYRLTAAATAAAGQPQRGSAIDFGA